MAIRFVALDLGNVLCDLAVPAFPAALARATSSPLEAVVAAFDERAWHQMEIGDAEPAVREDEGLVPDHAYTLLGVGRFETGSDGPFPPRLFGFTRFLPPVRISSSTEFGGSFFLTLMMVRPG